ncbi:MAG: hypothetical protein V7696_19265 [Halioglobus sp.]
MGVEDKHRINRAGSDYCQDFTEANYIKLLGMAKDKYRFVEYKTFDMSPGQILWRHDVDLSLERSVKFAEIEQKAGVVATYFINPHSEFYNLHEKWQFEKVRYIIKLGHKIGVHFDAAFYQTASSVELDFQVKKEAVLLSKLFDVEIAAVSFHNTSPALLEYDAFKLGGLINCYSKYFRQDVGYCSDSMGYWRYDRLADVLQSESIASVQVLTHPGLWQADPAYPRERVFRASFGRASWTLYSYRDKWLEGSTDLNVYGPAEALVFLKSWDIESYKICDYLWNMHRFTTLFIELHRLYKGLICQLCRHKLCQLWGVGASKVDQLMRDEVSSANLGCFFEVVFGEELNHVSDSTSASHKIWTEVYEQLMSGNEALSSEIIEEGCVYLCGIMERVKSWVENSSFVESTEDMPKFDIGEKWLVVKQQLKI